MEPLLGRSVRGKRRFRCIAELNAANLIVSGWKCSENRGFLLQTPAPSSGRGVVGGGRGRERSYVLLRPYKQKAEPANLHIDQVSTNGQPAPRDDAMKTMVKASGWKAGQTPPPLPPSSDRGAEAPPQTAMTPQNKLQTSVTDHRTHQTPLPAKFSIDSWAKLSTFEVNFCAPDSSWLS